MPIERREPTLDLFALIQDSRSDLCGLGPPAALAPITQGVNGYFDQLSRLGWSQIVLIEGISCIVALDESSTFAIR
jgi:hypothetical protein